MEEGRKEGRREEVNERLHGAQMGGGDADEIGIVHLLLRSQFRRWWWWW